MAMNPRLLRPLATGFDPRAIPGLALWLDAQQTATVLNSVGPDVAASVGQSVRRWSDRSGAGITADQTFGAWQPALQSAGEIAFDGSNDILTLSAAGLTRNKSYVAIFTALKTGTIDGTNKPLVYFSTANSLQSRLNFLIRLTGGFAFGGRRLNTDSFLFAEETTPPSSGTNYVVAGIADYGNAIVSVRRNAAETATSAFHGPGSIEDIDSTVSNIGGSSTYWDGSIYELLIYNGAPLTNAQSLAIEGYLAWKWGLQAQLPYDHPYAKSFPGYGSQTTPTDSDALTYLAAVAAADGTGVEVGVANAVDDFVKGCKADGIWDAIKASCILAGARTLAGALVPLKGAAPTPYNFAAGDYNRATGLVGNGSSKFLDSNRASNADGQNDKHVAVWLTSQHNPTNVFACQAGAGSNGAGAANLATTGRPQARMHTSTLSDPIATTVLQNGLWGASRAASGSYTTRQNGTDATISVASDTPTSDNLFIFCRNNGSGTGEHFTNARMAFYSIGSSLTLSLLDTRVGRFIASVKFALNTGLSPVGYETETITYISAGYDAGGSLA